MKLKIPRPQACLLSMLSLCFILVCLSSTNAQKYNTAVGIRLGNAWGMSVKQRIAKKTTLELIASQSLFRESTKVILLGEQHLNLITKRINLYSGGGLHLDFWKPEDAQEFNTGYGISVITGMEVSIGRFNISYDIIPAFTINGRRTIELETALSLRYIISKRRWKIFKKKGKRNWKFWKKDE